MDKAEEMFVVTDCCGSFSVTTSRPLAVKALGELVSVSAATTAKDKAKILDFLEGRSNSVEEVMVNKTHWRSIVSAKVLK